MPTQTLQVQTNAGMQSVEVPDFGAVSLKQFPQIQVDRDLLSQLQQISPNSDFSQLVPGAYVDPTQYLQIGSISGGEAFGIGQLSISQIARLSRANLQSLNLAHLGDVVKLQTPTSLIEDIPGFGNLPIQRAKPLVQLAMQSLQTKLGVPIDPTRNIDFEHLPLQFEQVATVSDLVKAFPDIAKLPLKSLGDFKLTSFKLDDLPGLSTAPLDQLKVADQALLKDLNSVGLGNIPLSKFPVAPKLAQGVRFAEVDVVLGPKEQNRLRVISGTIPRRDKFEEVECPGKSCPHIEMHDMMTTQYSGFAWLDGRLQAKDGYGPLCIPFGCKGPVGNHPFGKAFRVVVTRPQEDKGSITVGLKFRACKRLPFVGKTCTPYFFPPGDAGMPIGSFREKQIIPFLPPSTGKDVTGDDYTPPEIATEEDSGSDTCSASLPIDLKHLDAVTQAVINATPTDHGERKRAAQYIPYIMRSCAKAGLTDSAQLAYALATARHETDHFNTMEEYDKRAYDACGIGEGMIQVTHCYEKTKIMKRLGMKYGGVSDKRLQDFNTAADALCVGLKEGFYGQARPIAQCFSGGRANYSCARQQVNDHDQIELIASHARSYQSALERARAATPGTPPSINAPNAQLTGATTCLASAPASGSVNDRVLKSALANKGKINQCNDPATDYGRNGCMVAVDTVLKRAGLPMFGGSQPALSITSAIDGCKSGGRGTLINASDAKAGDILIMDDGVAAGHIGICTSDGCKTTISNSSGRCNFVWESDGCFSGSYGCNGRFTRYLCRVKG